MSTLEQLGAVLEERTKYKCPTLPLWKELGPIALQFLADQIMVPHEVALTQWSQLLGGEVPEEQLRWARTAAEFMEKGNDGIFELLAGKHITMWAPVEYNALTRFMASYMKKPTEQLPLILRLLVPIPILPGMDSVEKLPPAHGRKVDRCQRQPTVHNYAVGNCASWTTRPATCIARLNHIHVAGQFGTFSGQAARPSGPVAAA